MFSRVVSGKDFFGREAQQNILKERITAFKAGFRHNIAILGSPLMGKTSLIQNFLSTSNDNDIISTYVEARQEPFACFAYRFIGSLLFHYLNSKGHRTKPDVKWLIKYSKKALPRTHEAINRIEKHISKCDYNSAYSTLLDLPSAICSECKLKCIVVIEGFDRLSGFSLDKPFMVLGKKIMAQPSTLYIVTSSCIEEAKRILTEKLCLLFGNFELMELKELGFPTSRDFLLTRLAPHIISDRHIRFLIYFTNGHPFYLDIISRKLKDLLLHYKKKKASVSLIHQALNELLVNPAGLLHQHFSTIVESRCVDTTNGVDSASILLSLSCGKNRLKTLCQDLNASPRNVSKFISTLCDDGLVSKSGILHKIEDAVFKFWLKSIYRRQRQQFTADQEAIDRSFRSDLKKSAVSFKSWSKEDLYDRAVDLFKSFNGELVRIEHRNCRLPSFAEVAPRVIGDSGPYIIGHAKGKNWICQIRDREVCERHIVDFLRDTKRSKFRFHTKILIVINDIEVNAKLLAKESHIWIWNLKTLNQLLDIYGKPKVIRW